jgi:hypothetical protein
MAGATRVDHGARQGRARVVQDESLDCFGETFIVIGVGSKPGPRLHVAT